MNKKSVNLNLAILSNLNQKLDKMERKQFYLLCIGIFVIFLTCGLFSGHLLNQYRLYQLKNYEAKVEKEMKERLGKKLEKYNYQLR